MNSTMASQQQQLQQPSIPPTQYPDNKVLQDLSTVIEKINLCTTMLQPLNSTQQVDQDESLLTIVGFLEACVPRVRELIEAGMSGALKEDTVVKCLAVNDSLCQVLEYVEHPETCVSVSTMKDSLLGIISESEKDAAAAKPKHNIDFDAFGLAASNVPGSSNEDDFFALSDQKQPATNTPVGNVATSTAKSSASAALEDLLLTSSDDPNALPTPPPPRAAAAAAAATANTSGGVDTDVDKEIHSSHVPENKDPFQDEFDKFFDD